MLWSGLGPPCPQVGAGRECRACSQPCVASGPGSCRRTRPLTDAGSNVIFVCCSSWPGRPVSSLLQMLPDNDVRRLPAVLLVTFFFFFFSAGRFSWSVCNHGEMLACRLVAGALGSLLLQQLLLPSGPDPHFPHSLPLETVSLHCPWAALLKEEQCLGCRSVLFGCQVSQRCPTTFPLRFLAAGCCPPLAEHPMAGARQLPARLLLPHGCKEASTAWPWQG